MRTEDFLDGGWYIVRGKGRGRSHFYVRWWKNEHLALSSCGMVHAISLLVRSDDDKINPRMRCGQCWERECQKAKRT
jgi:hypothetical protein